MRTKTLNSGAKKTIFWEELLHELHSSEKFEQFSEIRRMNMNAIKLQNLKDRVVFFEEKRA